MADVTVDKVRIIRRSIRCLYFGLVGLIPVVGVGLATQALRLHREVLIESSVSWSAPLVQWYWLLGVLYVVGYVGLFGWAAALSVWMIFLIVQSYHLWRASAAGYATNPAAEHLRWGMILSYAGWLNTLLFLALLPFGVKKLIES